MLSGMTVLVAEREFLIALDTQRMIEELGGNAVLVSGSNAGRARLDAAHVNLAVIEIDGSLADKLDVAIEMALDGIPVILCTSDATLHRGHNRLPGAPVLIKPFSEREFAKACASALSARPLSSA